MPAPNDYVEYARWLGEQAFSGLLYGWPITLALICVIVLAGVWQLRYYRSPARLVCLLVPFVFPLLFLIWGTVMRVPPGSSPPSWPQTVLLVLFCAQLIAGILSVILLVRARWFSVCVVVFSLWSGYWCALLAAMSVGGVWL